MIKITAILSLRLLLFLFLSALFMPIAAQKMTETKKPRLAIKHIDEDFPVGDFANPAWDRSDAVDTKGYWSGRIAAAGRHFQTRLLWSETALYIRFEANQNEPLVVNPAPDVVKMTMGLWDRDVCEIFIAPDKKIAHNYFEFEVAPTGEWIDLAIVQHHDRRDTDTEYSSKLQSAAKIEKEKVWMALKIPWTAFNKTPKPGDTWAGNLFRCIGSGKTRGYLAWQPTRTKKPNFHVPAAFGEFEFVK